MCVKRKSKWSVGTSDEFIAVWREDDLVQQALPQLIEIIARRYFNSDILKASEYIGWSVVEGAKNSIANRIEAGEWEAFEELTRTDYNTDEVVIREDAEERAEKILARLGYLVE